MVNLDKWEKIEHNQVKMGDRLKIVWTEKNTPTLKTIEIHKGTVTRVEANGDFWVNGFGWEEVDDEREDADIYRRKDKPFKLPTELGAVISGRKRDMYGERAERTFMVFDGADWSSAHNAHNPATIEERFTDLRVERKGIKQK
jgi:hypothetical protein